MKPITARKRKVAQARRRKAKHHREIETITQELKTVKIALWHLRAEVDSIIDLMGWHIRHAKNVILKKQRDYKRAYYLRKKYESYWLGKVCRAPGGLKFRMVMGIDIKLAADAERNYDEVHVIYEGRWTHRVNCLSGGSRLPTRHALLIRK